VIFHQSIGVKIERIFRFVFRKVREIGFKIDFFQEYALFLVSSGDYMVEGAGEINPGSSSHGSFVAQQGRLVNTLFGVSA